MAPTVPAAASRVRLAAIGLQKIREKNRIARKHLPFLKTFFKQQREQVLGALDALKPYLEEGTIAKTNKAAPNVQKTALDKFTGLWDGIEKSTTPDLQNLVLKIEQDGMQAGGDLLKDLINPGGTDPKSKMWSLENPRAVKWFQKNGGSLSYINDIQSTTKDSLQRLITTGLDEGWSYNDTAKEIRKLYDGPISRDRAQLIAVNESAQAYEAGNREFGKSLEYDGVEMEKRWENSGDGKVSDGCLENTADGWIPIDQPHSSGHQNPPRFPGCRCWESYRQKGGSD